MQMLVLFDLDGVIFCEDGYLLCAALATSKFMFDHRLTDRLYDEELIYPDRISCMQDARKICDVFLPNDVLQVLREKSINNNWDKAFACTLGLLTLSTLHEVRNSLTAHLASWLKDQVGSGQAFLQTLRDYAKRCNVSAKDIYETVKNDFQLYYLGDQGAVTDFLRRGIVDQETTLLPVETIDHILQSLTSHGIELGIGTGRPRAEALRPLERLGLLPYFSMDRIMTHDDVRQEEDRRGLPIGALAKPHPYVYQRAAITFAREKTIVVGDSTADALAANDAGFRFYGIGSVASFGDSASLATSINSDVEAFAYTLLCSVSDLQ